MRKANQGKVSCLVCFLTSGYADASKNSSEKTYGRRKYFLRTNVNHTIEFKQQQDGIL